MSVIYSEFRGVVSLYTNSILGASSEAINVAASFPDSDCSQRGHSNRPATGVLPKS